MHSDVRNRTIRWGYIFLPAMAAVCVVAGCAAAQDEASSPWGHAALYRDEWGTPHVYAEDARSLAFVFGYAQAEDHFEAMLAAYRIANGRAAEVFGESYAASDEFSLKMGHASLARSVYDSLDPLTRDLCEGFATGVNAWLVEHAELAPPWADGVKPQDILALLHCYLMSMAPFDLPEVYHRPPASVSGNAWAVAPGRSESGEAILAINPHTYYGGPFLWYEAHLVCQDINVAGATLFGLPVILQGHNEVLGWALTPNQPDFADIYLEPSLSSKHSPKSINARPLPADGQLVEMYLAANARSYYVLTPEGAVERSVPCVDTPHGPLVAVRNGHLCAYQVGGYHDFGGIGQLVEMARARDLGAFQAALAMQQLPCFNVVYADREGNILYLYNVKTGDKFSAYVPISKKNKAKLSEGEDGAPKEPEKPPHFIDWTTPVAAGNSFCEWGAVLPMGSLPTVVNPASGYVQACGSPPWLATDNLDMKAEQFPSWFSHDADTARAQRVRRLLSMGKRSFRDCQSMLYDVVTPAAVEAIPHLLDAAKQRADFVSNAHPDLPAGLDVLRSWSFLADTKSPGMTFFHVWWSALMSRNAETFPTQDALLASLKDNGPDIQDLSLDAATEAARVMRNEFNSLSVPWGDVHTVTRGTREVPLCGASSGDPIFVASDELFESRKWRVTYGYGFAMVVAFGDKPRAVSMLPFGESEDPKSPHYSDQLDLMAERRFKVARYSPEEVEQNATSARGQTLRLRPKGMEAVVTLSAAAPIVARLTTATETPEKLPEDFVPFTLFMTTEKVPHSRPASTHIEIYVPPVLCSGQDLDKLAIYACDDARKWVKLDAQQLTLDSRTFTADDNRGPSTYAVLGPSKYRATRLEIPEEPKFPAPSTKIAPLTSDTGSDKTPAPVPETAEKPADAASAPSATETPPRKSRVTWGVPPKRKNKPFIMPGAEEAPTQELPKLDLAPPKPEKTEAKQNVVQEPANDEKKPRKKIEESPQPSASVKRNFTFGK